MSWQGDLMADQEAADALFYMGESEWREIMKGEKDGVQDQGTAERIQ